MLLEARLLTQSQLDLAIREQRRTHQLLGEVLVEMGFVKEEGLFQALSSQTGIPFIRPADVRVDPAFAALIPEETARKKRAVPLGRDPNGRVVIAMANPLDLAFVDQIQKSAGAGAIVRPVFATFTSIESVLNRLFQASTAGEAALEELVLRAEQAREENLQETIRGGPIAALVNQLIVLGARLRATDIHVEPDARVTRIRYRIDGMLRLGPPLPQKIQAAVIARVKILAGMDIAESRAPQDGKIGFDQAGIKLDLRVSTLPTQHGENVVIRILNRYALNLDLQTLGFDQRQLTVLRELIERPNGIILVTGPTGSGKTTTLYAALSAINTVERNIMTIEDPIEYEIPLIRQTQVNVKAGMTFAAGMRALLRQDPNVILLGEMRDEETASLAVRASLTGHLVFSTLHTNDAPGAIPRLLEMDIPPYLLATTVNAILAQRLLRTLCLGCRRPVETRPAHMTELLAKALGPAAAAAPTYTSPGCATCGGTGFTGRTTISELVVMDGSLREAILSTGGAGRLPSLLREQGWEPLLVDGLRRALGGVTSLDEVVRVAGNTL